YYISQAYKTVFPSGPPSSSYTNMFNSGCVGLACIYQGQTLTAPENAPGTKCFLTEAEARARKCPDDKQNFVFAKQGIWASGSAPKPNPITGEVPNNSIIGNGSPGAFNYVTTFPTTHSYAWMNHGSSSPGPQILTVSPRPVHN